MFPQKILVLFTTISVTLATNSSLCDEFQANFDMKSLIGAWHVVAVVPGKMFPEKEVSCYRVEFSETDEAGLRWLMNRTMNIQKMNITEHVHGTIVRQRYHSEYPFDVWSKSVEGVNGCFQQVMSLEIDNSDMHNALSHEAVMQLHFVDYHGESFLLQMLWGKMISAVVYRRHRGVTEDRLKAIYDQLTILRGPLRQPKICTKHLRETIVLN